MKNQNQNFKFIFHVKKGGCWSFDHIMLVCTVFTLVPSNSTNQILAIEVTMTELLFSN